MEILNDWEHVREGNAVLIETVRCLCTMISVGLDHQPRDQQAGDGGHHHRHLHILARLEWAHPIGSVHSAFRERPERVSSLFR